MTTNFVCENNGCGTIDSITATHQVIPGAYCCHRCIHGTWHGYFAEEKYSGPQDGPMLNRVDGDEEPSFS